MRSRSLRYSRRAMIFRPPSLRLCLIALVALAGVAQATTVIGETLEQMAAHAPLIVRGVVGQQQARWDDAGRRIHTFTEVKVVEQLKGEAPALVMVRQPGGEVGELGQRVAGVARFEPGEEVVLFLEQPADDASVWLVRGLGAGKIRLAVSAWGERRATRDLQGLAFWTPDPGAPEVRPVEPVEDLGTVDQLLRRLRIAIKRGGGSR